MRYLKLTIALLLPLTLISCRQTGEQKQQPPKDNKVHVDAYINVASGCTQATVDLLNQLGQQYADRIQLTFIDFGSDEGYKKWRAAGLDCLTIQFDGASAVYIDAPGGATAVTFQMPPDLGGWSHEDLEHAFAAAAVGKLRPATETEVRDANTPRSFKVKFNAQETKDLNSGKVKFQLLANGKSVAEISEKDGDTSAHDRASKAAADLNKWVAADILISDLRVEDSAPGRATIIAAGLRPLTATEADARADGVTDPKQVATKWMAGIKTALLESAKQAEAATRIE